MNIEEIKTKLADLAENGGGGLFLGSEIAQLTGLQADILLSVINQAYASGFNDGVKTLAKRLRGDV